MINLKIFPIEMMRLVFIFCGTFFSIGHLAYAVNVDLGDIPFTASTTTASANRTGSILLSAEQTIDGDNTSDFNGWGFTSITNNPPTPEITWTWQNSPTPDLSQGYTLDYYTYTINVHTIIGNPGWLILSASGPETNGFNIISEYESLSDDLTPYLGPEGRPDLAVPHRLDMGTSVGVHTLVFRSASLVDSLKLQTRERGSSSLNEAWAIREITGTVSAEVIVPEPSTTALLTGCFVLALFLFRKQVIHKA